MEDKNIPVTSALWGEEELLEIQKEYLGVDSLYCLTEEEIEKLIAILKLKYKLINRLITIDEYYEMEAKNNCIEEEK